MTPDAAADILSRHAAYPKSEVARAISVLLKAHKTYSAIPLPKGLSERNLRSIHKIAALPPGIQWKVDAGEISLSQAGELAKLSSEADQWLLAVFIVKEKIPAAECKILANAVEKRQEPMVSALRRISGIQIENAAPTLIPLSLPIDDYVHFAKAAWDRRISVADLCYEAARQAADANPAQVADDLTRIAERLRAAGSPSNRAPLSPVD